jgi:hypothetical protein
MGRPYLLWVLLTSILVLGMTVIGKSRAGTSEVFGTVKDQSGAVVPGASVQIVSEEHGWTGILADHCTLAGIGRQALLTKVDL